MRFSDDLTFFFLGCRLAIDEGRDLKDQWFQGLLYGHGSNFKIFRIPDNVYYTFLINFM